MDVSQSAIDLSLLSKHFLKMLFLDEKVRGISRNDFALIGDAIMSLLIREAAIKDPSLKIWKEHLVSNRAFAIIVKESGLASLVQEGGNSVHSLGTVLEALIGAVYWQHGFGVTKQFVDEEIFPLLEYTIPRPNTKLHVEVELIELCRSLSLPNPEFAIQQRKGLQGKVLVSLKLAGILDMTEIADSYITAIRTLANRAKQKILKKNLQPAPEKS